MPTLPSTARNGERRVLGERAASTRSSSSCVSDWPRHPAADRSGHVRDTPHGASCFRDRIDYLPRHRKPPLEIAPLAAWGLYDDQAPAAGVIAGIGLVSGRHCMIVCNDVR
jgi:3-methylcrotonyl-CoA carboxylase beta subunit